MDITGAFIIISLFVFFGAWLGYDLWVKLYAQPHGMKINTITWEIQSASMKSIAFPAVSMLLLGLLLGHLFLQF